MKKLLTIVSLLLLTAATYAQKDVTKFLGIPVDGTKSEMIRKLKSKGFISDYYSNDVLKGEFNGYDVNVHIVTTNNKVCRIMVCDANTQDEARIKIRFNILCQQFSKNKKYLPSVYTKPIPDDDDISYEMSVHNKRYDAVYYQIPEHIDTLAMQEHVKSAISAKYSKEQLSEMTEDKLLEEIKIEDYIYLYELCVNKSVWFTISEHSGGYYISMYYDNEYNRANGEDL